MPRKMLNSYRTDILPFPLMIYIQALTSIAKHITKHKCDRPQGRLFLLVNRYGWKLDDWSPYFIGSQIIELLVYKN